MTRAELDAIPGERGLPIVRAAASLHARLSNLLALGLMLTLGAVVLAVYYLHAAQRQSHQRQSAQAAAGSRAQSEMALPALGDLSPKAFGSIRAAMALDAPAVDSMMPAEMPVAAGAQPPPRIAGDPSAASSQPASGLDRRLSGSAFARGDAAGEAGPSDPSGGLHLDAGNSGAPAPGGNTALAALPRAEFGTAGRASLISSQRMLLPKGAFIDCTLETAIDSTLPGMTTCITATDTFGVDGRVVLLERGTKLVGETRGQVQQGSARVFVLWTEARTPAGVIVPLESPGTDELGRSGLAGSVDRHFWERFGAALLVSSVDGAVQAAVQSSTRGSGTVIYNPSAAQDVATEVLKSTLAIPPTVRKENGDRIQILVARDIDFTSVYELRRADRQP
jgi:type IV secretion system protein VirB10